MHYTIGIKIPFLPIWRKYKVTGHWFEASVHDVNLNQFCAIPVRMCLKRLDGSTVVLPNIAARAWRLYPDYRDFTAQVESMKREIEAEKARLLTDET